MHSSNKNDHSIRSALFDATIQLSVPTVTSAAPTDSKARASSTLESSVYSPARNLRRSLSSLSLALPKRFDLHKRKSRRASPTRPPPSAISTRPPHPCTNQSAALVDTNNNPTMISTVSSASEEYLSRPGSHRRSISARSSPTRQQHKSIRNALLGIWQGLNSDDLPSNASTSLPAQYVDEPRVKKNSPRWKAFSNVVTSLLTFTRTRKGRYEWIQLVGHPGTFKEGIHDGFVMKELCDFERCCCELLQNDLLRQFVPMYNGVVQDDNGKAFIEMEDLLASFHEPCIMDCKIGVRTYLEADLDKSERDPEPRADLYEKMIAIDPLAPTEDENNEKKILKPRYMMWRESLSSSENLGFRIEAIKKSRGLMSKEFQRIKERQDVRKQLSDFVAQSFSRATQYLDRLIQLRVTCLQSHFFQTHEIIGSSILFVHDENKASLWMIDFGKTRLLPDRFHPTHAIPWTRGSHEDGYLIGLDNLISLFREILDELK